MGIQKGIRVIRIVSARKAHLYGNWYKGLIGAELVVAMYDICAAEYTIPYQGSTRTIAEEDTEIAYDNENEYK